MQGVCLQGEFSAREPVTAVFEWVTTSLANPGIAYELVLPDRQPLPATGTVGEAGLMPTALLNFRPMDSVLGITAGGAAGRRGQQQRHQPFLSDALLQQARVT